MKRCLLVFEPSDGGVAENVLQLALGLSAYGWAPHVAGPPDAITYPRLAAASIPITRLPMQRDYRHPLRDAIAFTRLVALLRHERFDLVHVHSSKAGTLGRLAARITHTTVVYSPHCFGFVGSQSAFRRTFALTVERLLAPLSDGLLCVADDERRIAVGRRLADPARAFVVHNGTRPCDADAPADPELQAWAAGAVVAGCVTVLRPQKAVHVLVDAAPLILDAVADARIAIVGGGPLRRELEQRASHLQLDDRLRFFDFKPPSARQLRSLDVFVLPSAWEALPISLIEAMACGVPQVATDVGGTREVVAAGSTGILCAPGDPDELADAVITLLRDPTLRRRMSVTSRQRQRELFTVERMVERTTAAYRAAASRSSG